MELCLIAAVVVAVIGAAMAALTWHQHPSSQSSWVKVIGILLAGAGAGAAVSIGLLR